MQDRSSEPLPTQLHPLPSQPAGRAWPTLTWATGPQLTGDPDRLDDVLSRAFRVNPNSELALSLAFVAVQGGRIVAERYGPGTTASSTCISWSTAKSITQVALGLALKDGLIDLDAPAPVPQWSDPEDPRHAITIRHLLAMRSGLEFNEDYVDAGSSHCLEMLFGEGAQDMAAYAAGQPLIAPIDSEFNYASGTTVILSRILTDALGGQESCARYLQERLFDPLGMSTAEPKYDPAGTFVGSSYVYATARDFARFGLFALRGGIWQDEALLPPGWIDDGRRPLSYDPSNDHYYGEHWWSPGDRFGTFQARGYEGQVIAAVPALDLVVVRLGKSPIEHAPALRTFFEDVLECFVEDTSESEPASSGRESVEVKNT
jgi:CubicO group peptidase (beta-lactamase class C family)